MSEIDLDRRRRHLNCVLNGIPSTDRLLNEIDAATRLMTRHPDGLATYEEGRCAEALVQRIASRSSVSAADFPKWWADYWREREAVEKAVASERERIRREVDTRLFEGWEPASPENPANPQYDPRLDPAINSQGRPAHYMHTFTWADWNRGRGAYEDVGQPSPVAHMSHAWVHAGASLPAAPTIERNPTKTVFLPQRHSDSVAEALGIALLDLRDADGRCCPLPLCDDVARGKREAMQAIFEAAAIPGFKIVIGAPGCDTI